MMRPPFALLLACALLAPLCGVRADDSPGSDSSARDKERFVKALIQRADWRIAHGEFTGAIEDADRAIAEFPGDDLQSRNVKAKAFNVKANAHNRLKEFAAAAEAARQSLRHEPENPAAYENLASAQVHQDRFDMIVQAAENASRAIDLNARLGRNGAMGYYLRACANEKLGKAEQKLADIREAARLDSRFLDYVHVASSGGRLCAAKEDGVQAEAPGAGWLLSDWLGTMAWPALGLLVAVVAFAGMQLFRKETGDAAALKALGARQALTQAPVWVRGGKLLAGKYEFGRVIGKGGMGEVWEARDQSLGRPVAIKRMSAALGALGPQAKEIYLKEAKTLASVHHPNIVDIYEILDMPDGMYLVFELVAGKTVQQILVEKKRLPLARVKEILRPVCSALDWAHSRHIVHRDLKPSNIMVTDQGFVKVMDFGIARRTGADAGGANGAAPLAGMSAGQLHTKTIGGTPAYMAPEAEQGIVSAGSDVYSLGVCFYEMLTDELPFGPGGLAKLEMNYPKASWKVRELAPEVDALIEAALAPSLEARVPSAAAFLARLDKLPDAPAARVDK